MPELTLRQTVGQLRLLLQRRRIAANQIGEAGCGQRLKARDDVQALEVAIALLQRMTLAAEICPDADITGPT